jgi:hypothetical protein
LTSETGTGIGTVTCKKVGTGTVINYGSGTGTRYNIMHLITFIKKLIYKLFPCKTAYYVKRQKNSKKFS